MASKNAIHGHRAQRKRLLGIIAVLVLAAAVVAVIIVMRGGTAGSDASAPNKSHASSGPQTSFDDTKPSDWPEGKTTGCKHVVDRLQEIHDDLDVNGSDGLRDWFDTLDALEGDPAMDGFTDEFEKVKRAWSTYLSNAGEKNGMPEDELVSQSLDALQPLVDAIDCEQ